VDFGTFGDEENGTPGDGCVTVRDRDSMEQIRMPVSEVKNYIERHCAI
jgi:glycyl-tRNA synthetase